MHGDGLMQGALAVAITGRRFCSRLQQRPDTFDRAFCDGELKCGSSMTITGVHIKGLTGPKEHTKSTRAGGRTQGKDPCRQARLDL
jgi:hypothetical protein